MFICSKCHPEDHCLAIASSYGRCEVCGRPGECVDCHSNKPLKPAAKRVVEVDMKGNAIEGKQMQGKTKPKRKCDGVVVRYEGLARYQNPCQRNATVVRDGKRLCNSHDPEAQKARAQKRHAKWEADFQERSRKRRVEAACMDLFRELAHLVRLLEPLEQSGSLDVPGLATLNGPRAAIRKAGGLKALRDIQNEQRHRHNNERREAGRKKRMH